MLDFLEGRVQQRPRHTAPHSARQWWKLTKCTLLVLGSKRKRFVYVPDARDPALEAVGDIEAVTVSPHPPARLPGVVRVEVCGLVKYPDTCSILSIVEVGFMIP